jgi:hypothetical protein
LHAGDAIGSIDDCHQTGQAEAAVVADPRSYVPRRRLDVWVIFDCQTVAPPIKEQTRFQEARTPSGRRVALLRA